MTKPLQPLLSSLFYLKEHWISFPESTCNVFWALSNPPKKSPNSSTTRPVLIRVCRSRKRADLAILYLEALLLYFFDEEPFQYFNTFFDKNTTLFKLENPPQLVLSIYFEVTLQHLPRIWGPIQPPWDVHRKKIRHTNWFKFSIFVQKHPLSWLRLLKGTFPQHRFFWRLLNQIPPKFDVFFNLYPPLFNPLKLPCFSTQMLHSCISTLFDLFSKHSAFTALHHLSWSVHLFSSSFRNLPFFGATRQMLFCTVLLEEKFSWKPKMAPLGHLAFGMHTN